MPHSNYELNLYPMEVQSFMGGLEIMLPFTDILTSIAVVRTENEVFVSLRYVPDEEMDTEELSGWLCIAVRDLLRASGINPDDIEEVDANG